MLCVLRFHAAGCVFIVFVARFDTVLRGLMPHVVRFPSDVLCAFMLHALFVQGVCRAFSCCMKAHSTSLGKRTTCGIKPRNTVSNRATNTMKTQPAA
jgi:hypothetical protein